MLRKLQAALIAALAVGAATQAYAAPSPFAGRWLFLSDLEETLDTGLAGMIMNVSSSGKVSLQAMGFTSKGPKTVSMASGRIAPDGSMFLRYRGQRYEEAFSCYLDGDVLYALAMDGEEYALERIAGFGLRGNYQGQFWVEGFGPFVAKATISASGDVTLRVRGANGREQVSKGWVTAPGALGLMNRSGFDFGLVYPGSGYLYVEGASMLVDGSELLWQAVFTPTRR